MVIRIWHLFDLASMIKRAPPHTTWPSIGPRRIGSPSIFFNSARISAWRGTRGLWGWPWIWWLWPWLVNDDDDYESPLRRRCPPGWGRAGHQVQAPQLPAAWQEHLQSYKSNKKILPVAILKETSWWQLERNTWAPDQSICAAPSNGRPRCRSSPGPGGISINWSSSPLSSSSSSSSSSSL